MPKPKHQGDGPWGRAIAYWLQRREATQADLVKATGLAANTVSRVLRGLDTTTKILRQIAQSLEVPLAHVWVSPDERMREEDRARIAHDAAQLALKALRDAPLPEPPLKPGLRSTARDGPRATPARRRRKRSKSTKKPPSNNAA